MSENEERARRMGWVPQEEFKGDPEKWVDADKFVERGENVMPVLKENLSRMESKFEDYQKNSEQKIEKLNKTLERVVALSKTASERAYQKALRDLKNQQRKAAADGDVQTYDAIEKQIIDLGEDTEEPKPPENKDQINPDFEPWQKQNFWYGADKELTAFANGLAPIVGQEMPNVDGKTFFDEITKRVKSAFPHKFENPNRGKADAVEGESFAANEGKSGRKKTFNDLPNDAKEACKSFVSQGLFKNNQEYVDEYFAEEEV